MRAVIAGASRAGARHAHSSSGLEVLAAELDHAGVDVRAFDSTGHEHAPHDTGLDDVLETLSADADAVLVEPPLLAATHAAVARAARHSLERPAAVIGIDTRPFDAASAVEARDATRGAHVIRYTVPALDPDRRPHGGDALPSPRSDVSHAGPLFDGVSAPVPGWWPELLEATSPIVVVAARRPGPSFVLATALRALSTLPVVVAGFGDDAQRSVVRAVPPNALLGDLVPTASILPFADVVVTDDERHVHEALAHGVPVVAGGSAAAAEAGRRVRRAGAGVALGTDRPTVARIRRAVRHVLAHAATRVAARAIAADIASRDPIAHTLDVIDRVLSARAAR